MPKVRQLYTMIRVELHENFIKLWVPHDIKRYTSVNIPFYDILILMKFLNYKLSIYLKYIEIITSKKIKNIIL